MTRGRPRNLPDSDAPGDVISLAEAKERGLWAIHRVRRGRYTCGPAGDSLPGRFCGWAKDKPSALNACAERSRDDLHPEGARHQDDGRGGRARRGR